MYYLSMYYVRFSLTYLPTQKSDILYGRSPTELILNYLVALETPYLAIMCGNYLPLASSMGTRGAKANVGKR